MSVVTDKKGADGRPIPILATDRKQLPKLLAGLGAAERRWIERCEFDAEPNTCALVADGKGAIARVLIGVRDGDDPWALAGLPLKLPRARYTLGKGPVAIAPEKAAFAWDLGAYRFTRYKKPKARAADLQLAASPEVTAALELAAAVRPPRLLEIRWGNPKDRRFAIVGKGVCFDSGGLDLKTHEGMRLMKKDLGGAAHALALARLVMQRKLPVSLHLLIPTVENAVSGNA